MGKAAEKLYALALSRVVTRSMAVGRSLEYQEMLLEVSVEIDVLLDHRLERDARLACRAQEMVREAQVRHAAVMQTRTVSPDDVERDLRSVDMALGPPLSLPKWHPEHPENDS